MQLLGPILLLMTHEASPDVARNVAMALSRYLDGAGYDAQAAAEDVSRDLCLWLGALIARRLAEEEGWSPWWTIDDACPQEIRPVDGLAVDLVGIAWTLGDTSLGSEQPFHVTARLTPSRDGLSGYTIRFGDASLGLGPLDASDRRRRRWPEVETWHYVIEG